MSGSTWGDSWGSCWGDTWGEIDTQSAGGIRRRAPLPGRDLRQDDEEIMLLIVAALHVFQEIG